MKKILTALAVTLLTAATSVGVASAAPRNVPTNPGVTTVSGKFTDPSCAGSYSSKTTISGYGSYFNGSAIAARQLVYVNAGGSYVVTGVDGDCVVIAANASGNYVNTGAGADTINSNSTGNELEGGAGNDVINSNGTGDYLVGGAGTDTCNYDYNTSAAASCEK